MDEVALQELLSGRRRGLGATLIRSGLALASWLYAPAMRARNIAYDYRIFPIHRVSVPVISLGNVTTGGTGKTPLAAWLANWLIDEGYRPGLLSRGYRSLAKQPSSNADLGNEESHRVNDEKLVLDRLCPGVPHLQQKDRVSAAKRAIQDFQCNVLILDDGFQHRRLHRDLDIVLIDALQPWGYGYVLPRGLLRESLIGLSRADVVLATRIDQCSSEESQQLRARLSGLRTGDEPVALSFRPSRLIDLNGSPHPLESVMSKTSLAFCGIGNPESFRRTMTSLGVRCEHFCSFPDHHQFSRQDLSEIAHRACKSSVDIVLTTQKDLVKIEPQSWAGPPLFAIEIGVEFLDGLNSLESRLRRALSRSSAEIIQRADSAPNNEYQ